MLFLLINTENWTFQRRKAFFNRKWYRMSFCVILSLWYLKQAYYTLKYPLLNLLNLLFSNTEKKLRQSRTVNKEQNLFRL